MSTSFSMGRVNTSEKLKEVSKRMKGLNRGDLIGKELWDLGSRVELQEKTSGVFKVIVLYPLLCCIGGFFLPFLLTRGSRFGHHRSTEWFRKWGESPNPKNFNRLIVLQIWRYLSTDHVRKISPSLTTDKLY